MSEAPTTWHYEHGTWTETTFFHDAYETYKTDSFDECLKQLGCEFFTSIGDSEGAAFGIRVYQRHGDPRFAMVIEDGNIFIELTIGTIPDLLDLLARYAPIVSAVEISRVIQDINSLEPSGIVTQVLAAAEVNRAHVTQVVRSEEHSRREARVKWEKQRAAK